MMASPGRGLGSDATSLTLWLSTALCDGFRASSSSHAKFNIKNLPISHTAPGTTFPFHIVLRSNTKNGLLAIQHCGFSCVAFLHFFAPHPLVALVRLAASVRVGAVSGIATAQPYSRIQAGHQKGNHQTRRVCSWCVGKIGRASSCCLPSPQHFPVFLSVADAADREKLSPYILSPPGASRRAFRNIQ